MNKKYLCVVIPIAFILGFALFLNWELSQPIFSDVKNSATVTSLVTSCTYDPWTGRTNVYLNNGLHLYFNGAINLLTDNNYTITYRTDSYRIINWRVPETQVVHAITIQCQFEAWYFDNKSIGILLNKSDLIPLEVLQFSKPYAVYKTTCRYEINTPARFLFQWKNGTAIGYKDFFLFPKMLFRYNEGAVDVFRLE